MIKCVCKKPDPVWYPVFDFCIPLCWNCKRPTDKRPYDVVEEAYSYLADITPNGPRKKE